MGLAQNNQEHHTEGLNWLFRCGLMCAYDHERQIGYQSNLTGVVHDASPAI